MTAQQICDWFKKMDEFEKMTPGIYQEFRNWKLETDLEFIVLRGEEIQIRYVTYIMYFEWRLGLDELNRVQLEQSDIEEEFTPYEEVV